MHMDLLPDQRFHSTDAGPLQSTYYWDSIRTNACSNTGIKLLILILFQRGVHTVRNMLKASSGIWFEDSGIATCRKVLQEKIAVFFMYIVKNWQEAICCLVVRSSYTVKRKNNIDDNKKRMGLEKQPLSLLQTLPTNQLINKVRNLFIVFLESHGITAELLYSSALTAAPSIQLVILNNRCLGSPQQYHQCLCGWEKRGMRNNLNLYKLWQSPNSTSNLSLQQATNFPRHWVKLANEQDCPLQVGVVICFSFLVWHTWLRLRWVWWCLWLVLFHLWPGHNITSVTAVLKTDRKSVV